MNYRRFFFLVAAFLVYFGHLNAQVFERAGAESKEAFVKRIFPTDALMEFKVIESKFNSATKKIIFFSKKTKTDTLLDANKKADCLYANVLYPANETSANYSLQTLLIACSHEFSVQIDNAYAEKDKKKTPVIGVSVVEMNRASTRLLLKTYKTFRLSQVSENNFTIEELKE